MKEAIGTSMVFSLIMVFVGVIIAILVGSLAYTKGFKVRNRIIDIIQAHDGYDEAAKEEIAENLSAIGYRITKGNTCKTDVDGAELVNDEGFTNDYNYCIYKYKTSKGFYYGVTVFIHFDIPIVGDYINIPLYGETRVIFEKGEITG